MEETAQRGVYALYSSPNVIWVIKLRRMRWVCGTYGGQERCIEGFGVEI